MTAPDELTTDQPVPDKLTASVTRSPWTPDRVEWAALLGDAPVYRLDQLWHGLYDESRNPIDISTLPKSMRTEIDRR
ncbi:MAG: hypothetical protein OEW83_17685, partial [Acidimicrobiia bacterium]|nr:hypothetical protein [Acidimicrobiia bacterium]